MLMTTLLSFAYLQQPPMAMSQPMPEPIVLTQSVDTENWSASQDIASRLSLSPNTQACGTANNSRKSCGGTGRRELL